MHDKNQISPATMQRLRDRAQLQGVSVDEFLVDLLDIQPKAQWVPQVIQALPTVVLIVDQSGMITFANQRIADVFGYAPEEVVNQSLEILVPQSQRQLHARHRNEYFEAPSIRLMGKGRKLKGAHKSGNNFPVEVGLSYIELDGNIHGVAIVTDLTEEEQAKRVFNTKESRARAVLEAIPDVVIRYNPDGVFLDYHMGIPQGDTSETDDIAVAPDLYGVFPDDVVNALTPAIECTLESGELQKIGYRMAFPEGENSYYEARIVKSGAREVTIIVRDISEQKQIEAELRRTTVRMRDIIEAGHIGLWQWELGTTNSYYSPEWKKQLGYADDEFPNDYNAFEAELHPDDLPRIRTAIERTIAESRQNERVEYRMRHKDGSYRWIVAQGSVVEDEAGKPVQLIGTTVDITEQKEAQQYEFDLALEKERLKLLREFIQGAAHEFRTPLSIINTCMYLIERLDDEDAKQARKQQITIQVQRLANLVDMLLLMVKLESSNVLERKHINIADVIKSIVTYRQQANPDKATLQQDLETDLPTVFADEEFVREAISQLLDNAYRATDATDVIRIKAYRKNERVHIEILDTGVGISPENLPHIFKTFWRDDKVHSTPGFGLGLPITQKIIEQHGGNLTVRSQLNQGTLMTISLPIREPQF